MLLLTVSKQNKTACPMPRQTLEFTTDKRFARRACELKTIATMVGMYCRGHGHDNRKPLCASCSMLLEYATRRLDRCVFGDAKPTCANCIVHCYSADKRDQIRVVMKWAGPRMLIRHPIQAILHLLHGHRPAPSLPAKPAKQPSTDSAET
ncbi:MAG: nitrous oxide-stimulated promoter family protein [Georgfuchsia sp.]